MASFFKLNVPGKAKRNEIPHAIKSKIEKILSAYLFYNCDPEKGTATVSPSKVPVINDKGEVESVQIRDLYDVSQINYCNGEIPVTKLYLKSGVNSSGVGLALQAMVSVVRQGLCEVFLKEYFVDYNNLELGRKYETKIVDPNEPDPQKWKSKSFWDTYTGHFFYLIPRSCGLATFAEVKNRAIEVAKAKGEDKTEESPITNSNPVIAAKQPGDFSWGEE